MLTLLIVVVIMVLAIKFITIEPCPNNGRRHPLAEMQINYKSPGIDGYLQKIVRQWEAERNLKGEINGSGI